MKIPVLKTSFISSNLLSLLCLLTLLLGGCDRFGPSNTANFDDALSIYLGENAGINDVFTQMEEQKVLVDLASFKESALNMNLGENVHPGKYKIMSGMNNPRNS